MPNAPTNFMLSRAGIDHTDQGLLTNLPSVLFTWTNNAPGSTHRLQAKSGVGGVWRNAFRAGDGQASASLHGLALATSYHFRIRSESPDGGFSAWVPLNVDPHTTAARPVRATDIAPPTRFAVASNDYRGVVFSWSDNANNESTYVIEIDGPAMTAREFYVDHLVSGTLSLPVGVADGLQHAKTYTAKIKARGGKQTRSAHVFDTDYSADISFTTVAPHIAITNLPIFANGGARVLRGQPFTFQILTNTPATAFSIVAGALPAGLTLSGGTLSGTTVAAEGTSTAQVKAQDALTDDTQPLVLVVATPAFNFTNLPSNPVAWRGIAFSFRCLTNTPATSFAIIGGALPAGLALAGDTISGTTAATDGIYSVTIQAQNALTNATATVAIELRTPELFVLLKPHDSPAAPKPGPAWGEVAATLGQLFEWDASAQAVGPIPLGNTVTLDNAPAWLALNGLSLIGTPDVAGVWDIGVNWTSGAYSGSTTLRVRVKPVHITSAGELTVHEDEPFQFVLSSTPRADFSSPDDLPADVEIFSPEASDQWLRGTAREVGDYPFQIVATAGLDQDTQDFTLHVLPLITLGDGTDHVEGWEGDPLLEMLQYHGPCEVERWYLSGAPPGVEIGTLGCPGAYAGSHDIVAITGIPTADGFFDATITAHVCCNHVPGLHRFHVRFAINGGLFLAWLHEDRTLYDLQFQIRGDLPRRAVQSWYQRAARGESKSTSTTKDTSTSGVEKSTTTESTEAADAGNLLTAKRGDHLRLALLIRDGRQVLGTTDGIANVGIAFRLPDSADEEYLFDLPGVPTTVNGHEYFLAEFDVTQELLDELMGDDSVSGSTASAPVISTLAEIRGTFNGRKISSATFPVTFVEDVER